MQRARDSAWVKHLLRLAGEEALFKREWEQTELQRAAVALQPAAGIGALFQAASARPDGAQGDAGGARAEKLCVRPRHKSRAMRARAEREREQHARAWHPVRPRMCLESSPNLG